MNKKPWFDRMKLLFLALPAVLVLAACTVRVYVGPRQWDLNLGPVPTIQPTYTRNPTYTPRPTYTPMPTNTPLPTYTPLATPAVPPLNPEPVTLIPNTKNG